MKNNISEALAAILDMEFRMFTSVNDVNGRAPCQNDKTTFHIMRSSQLSVWTEEMIEQYRRDLEEALAEGQNIMMEKYGYMMEFTDPASFRTIREKLPHLSAEKRAAADEIVKCHVGWRKELLFRYPALMKGARPTSSYSDTEELTSYETYLRCELYTYSAGLLELYRTFAADRKEAGINLDESILEAQVRQYGYSNPLEANDTMAQVYCTE